MFVGAVQLVQGAMSGHDVPLLRVYYLPRYFASDTGLYFTLGPFGPHQLSSTQGIVFASLDLSI